MKRKIKYRLIGSLLLLCLIFGFLLKKTIFIAPLVINNTSQKEENTEIIIAGDVMLGRSVMTRSLFLKSPNYPFEKVVDVLKQADITFVNLENPIIQNCPFSDDGLVFCSSPEMINGLVFAGVDIVSLANNHTKNYGNDGLLQTENFLKKEEIDYVGVSNLVIKKVNQTNFGFLGFDFTTQSPTENDYQLIEVNKTKVDVLIVMVHWGTEYTSTPTKVQKEIAQKIVKSGADVVVGAHPHWVQKMEYVEDKPVFYSLGNFIFDQSWSEETKKGLAIKLSYQNKGLIKIDQMPIYMENFAQPRWE